MRRRSFRGRRRFSRRRYSGAARRRHLAARQSRKLDRVGFRL